MTSRKEVNQKRILLLDPSGEVPDPERRLASRLAGVQGKMVGLVGVTRDTIERVGELLVERHGARGYMFRQKPEISQPCPDEIFDEFFSAVDCVVVGVGV
jgi:hypothetical protein